MFKAAISVMLFALAQNPVQQHIDAAKKAAGTPWSAAADYFCAETQVTNAATDPEVEPTQVFDNLYFFGNKGTLAYAITTSDGIILIDAGYADQVESNLLAGMNKLGLDPSKIKYVIITHGHRRPFRRRRIPAEPLRSSRPCFRG